MIRKDAICGDLGKRHIEIKEFGGGLSPNSDEQIIHWSSKLQPFWVFEEGSKWMEKGGFLSFQHKWMKCVSWKTDGGNSSLSQSVGSAIGFGTPLNVNLWILDMKSWGKIT
ncbi:hypothetical protein CDAR_128121 [Caerostris darwini]|uniref:Uncharacterized protein n=1 Tax=Caerostris darwini TaxID=1538125 RepID=A0AAV4VAW9_9ARAC|nr:hypothetical protein CDAR_128121 [Caerostris darwini]